MANLKINGNLNAGSISHDNVNIFEKIYPVGSVYISINNTNPQVLFDVGAWEMLPENHTLWSVHAKDNDEPIPAGLPNITGEFRAYTYDHDGYHTGAFGTQARNGDGPGGGASNRAWVTYNFDASRLNSIYGNNSTVQPPAVKVYMWKRTS